MAAVFAGVLQAQLEAAGITAYRLSQLTGISKGTMSKLLSGKVQPSWESVLRISRALNVSCEAFAADVELPDPPDARAPGRPPLETATGPKKRKGKS